MAELPQIKLVNSDRGELVESAVSGNLKCKPVVALIINFNTASQTLRAVESLCMGTVLPLSILVLDNGSAEDDFEFLKSNVFSAGSEKVKLYRSEDNIGFAQGSNVLIDQAFENSDCQFVLLLNNDAVAKPRLLDALYVACTGQNGKFQMAGARMHKLHAPDKVDTLGIAVYASLMPADRQTTDDPFMGPTGGCALLGRSLLDELHRISGYWFDPRYFCYCEDTDLVFRARLLGYEAVYVDELLALHEGQASALKKSSDFISYHGLRNIIWMQMKLIPPSALKKYILPLLLGHLATCVLYILTGRGKVLFRSYRDGFGQRASFMAERTSWEKKYSQAHVHVFPWIAPRFYRKGYFYLVLKRIKSLLKFS